MLLPDDLDPPLTDEDLEAYFEWDERDESGEEDQSAWDNVSIHRVAAWSVCDTGSAEFAMRRLAHAEAVIAQRDAEAAEFHRQIDRWLAGEVKPHQRAVNFFTGQLVTYARRLREEEKQFTLNLPSGAVTSRRNPARPEVAEDKPTRDAFIAWATARELPLVKAKWSPVMAEVRKRVEFVTVWVPDWTTEALELIAWPDADGELAAWVALPRSVSGEQLHEWRTMPADGLPNFHAEMWPVHDAQRVPGVVLVPEEVTYTVKAGRP